MKKIILFTLMIAAATAGKAQIVTCGSPFANFGLPITFCGYVKGAERATVGKNTGTVLYLCGEYPNQGMTIVLKDTDPLIWKDAPEEWIGKRVCASGTVQTFKGKYYIAVKKKSQLSGD